MLFTKCLKMIPLLAFVCLAQTDSASLRVLVVDSQEAPIPGAKVTLRNTGTAVQSETQTSADGYALFSPIVRGTYEVTVTQAGFNTVKLNAITINVDERRLVRVPMEVATVTETVEVTASIVAPQTEQASLG